MSEVRRQAPHATTVGLQRGKIREWLGFLRHSVKFVRVRLHAKYLRMSLRFEWHRLQSVGFRPCKD
jgi:hypothetical protein